MLIKLYQIIKNEITYHIVQYITTSYLEFYIFFPFSITFLFLITFFFLFAVLYFFNVAYIGITSPANYYINFFDKYLNYIDWLRELILRTSNQIVRLAGFNAEIFGEYRLGIKDGPAVSMVYSCIGYGVMSLWVAFIIAHNGKIKQKILWIVIGCISILIINCFRVSLLLIALIKNWNVNGMIEHHTLFNIISYLLIFFLIYVYTNKISPAQE